MVIAEETRSQHENRARCLRRLRQAFYLHLREPVATETLSETLAANPDLQNALVRDARLRLGRRDPHFWPAVGVVLDVVVAVEARVGAAAELLGISTGNLISFLRTDANVWQTANQLRTHYGHKPLIA
jgi:hypothetical protein